MKLLLERTIELLRTKVRENLRIIDENQSRITEMLKNPVSEEEKMEFEACYTENKKLLIENNDFVHLQLVLNDFLEKHKSSSALSDELLDESIEFPIDENIIFDMTVSEELAWDNLHPLFGDDKFFDKLIRYYTSIEAYEKCSELYKTRVQM
jgi:hypothetical protein